MKMKNLFVALGGLALIGGASIGLANGHKEMKVASAGSATETTVYCAISSATLGTYSLKLNTNQQTNPDSWHQYSMSSAGTYGDLLLYSCTYTDLWGGVAAMQFQLYDGETWKAQTVAVSSWADVSSYNGKTWLYDSSSWDVAHVDTTLRVTFASDVPDYVDIYIPGSMIA